MTPQELKEIEARANAATPGPWIASFTRCGTGMGYNSYAHQVRIGIHEHTVAHSEVVTGDVVSTRRSQTLVNPTNAKPTLEPDADFIAHARQDIPNLLAYIAALTERLRAVEAERDADEKLIADLVTGMDSWAAEEDHEIYADAWPAYCNARARLVWEFADQKPSGTPPKVPKLSALRAELERMQAVVDAARKAKHYLEHRTTCKYLWDGVECDCGYISVSAALDAALSENPDVE